MKKQNGFSLVEILVVVVILGIIGTVGTQSLFSLLRGASKTEIIKELKQNGDYAMSVMDLKIRNSTITDANCTNSPLTITNSLTTTTTYSCDTGRIKEVVNDDGVIQTNYLTNTMVKVDCSTFNISCSFNGYNKVVTISFTLNQANTDAGAAESASQTFNTQITLRNN